MSKILVFGAGGRAGRTAVDEARRRGHEVTAAVRTPGKYAGLDAAVVAADITDPAVVAGLAVDHDAVIAAVYDDGADPADFFSKVGQALAEGIGQTRLVWVGLASILATGNGTPLMDSPGAPAPRRPARRTTDLSFRTHSAVVVTPDPRWRRFSTVDLVPERGGTWNSCGDWHHGWTSTVPSWGRADPTE